MSCSSLFSGDASVVSRRWSDVSFRQRLAVVPRQFLRQPLPSLFRCQLVAATNDNLSKQLFGTRNCFPSLFSGDNGDDNNGNGAGGDDGWWYWGGGDDNSDGSSNHFLFLIIVLSCFLSAASAIAKAPESDSSGDTVWEVRGSKRKRLVPDFVRDEFVSEESGFELSSSLAQCRNLLTQFLLPEGFPNSVTSDYLDYSLWRGVQGIASQISGVLAT